MWPTNRCCFIVYADSAIYKLKVICLVKDIEEDRHMSMQTAKKTKFAFL